MKNLREKVWKINRVFKFIIYKIKIYIYLKIHETDSWEIKHYTARKKIDEYLYWNLSPIIIINTQKTIKKYTFGTYNLNSVLILVFFF